MKLQESLFYSVSPFRLLELDRPLPVSARRTLSNRSASTLHGIYHQRPLGLFATLYAGAFAPIGALALLRRRAAGARFARILALVTLVVCVVPSLVPARWGTIASPLPLRNPEKFAVGLALALAVIAGLAFDRFRHAPPRTRGLLLAAAALCVVAGASRLWPAQCRRDYPAGTEGASRKGASWRAGSWPSASRKAVFSGR